MTGPDNVQLLADLTGLTHDVFTKSVVPLVRRKSIAARIYMDAQKDAEYRLEGSNLKFAVDTDFVTGGIATSGYTPDHIGMDAVQGTLNPIRRYRTIAMDNFVERAARDPGAFQDFSARLFDQLWSSWYSMEVRHAIGYANALVAKVESRTSSTVVILKDGYGNVGTSPLLHISKNSILCWYDVSGTAIAGAGTVTAIDYATRAVTLTTAGSWEPGEIVAADDLIYFATTPSITATHFTAERNLGPNGLGTIIDPLASLTTVFGIAQGDNPRTKPMRQTSVTFTHLELTRHWLKLGAKRGFDVSPQTDVAITYPAVAAQLAETLMAFQQQAYTGETLKGGYNLSGGSGNDEGSDLPHAGVQVAGVNIYTDGFFYHNVLATIPREKLFRADLGGDADFYTGDGNQWARMANYDGQTAFVREYMQGFSPDRGAFGALTAILTPDLDDTDFDASVPSY